MSRHLVLFDKNKITQCTNYRPVSYYPAWRFYSLH